MLKAVFLGLLMLPTSLQAQDREIPYSKINPLLSIETQSPLIEKTLSVKLTDTALSYEDVNVWLTRDGEIISPISVDSVDGRIQLAALTEQESQRHALRINQPKERPISTSSSRCCHHPVRQCAIKTFFFGQRRQSAYQNHGGAMAFLHQRSTR